ncbi:MAG: hypothetical protein ACPG21_07120 [Crocinitomicaceae bacterium]
MKKISALTLFLSIIILGCKNQQESTVETIDVTPKGELEMNFNTAGRSAPIGIQNVSLTGNKMSIEVIYSGGCKDHKFRLLGHPMISKSIPPQRSIKLHHNNNGDECREQIEETLVFDVSAFAYDGGEISLMLEGYQEVIPYIPQR